MKNTFRLLLLGATMLLSGFSHLIAQTDVALLRDLAEENKKSVEALVLYPTDTRLAILEATKSPEVLIKMQDMREKTSAAFRTLIEDFPRSTQTTFYDLSRYPGLIETLVQGKNDPASNRRALEVLPADKREDAFGVVNRQMPTLVKINDLNQTTQRAFRKLVEKYPAPAQNAFQQLLDLPEVIDLLNEDLRFTILVGETYSEHPAWVIQQMDSLNLAVARSHAEELKSWKSSLESDPAAQTELDAAAREYANAQGYDPDEYQNDDVYADSYDYDPYDAGRVNHYYDPYPYWYGYPWWEPYPRWHPYPWWWDWGYYNQPHGVVIVYLPSYHFMNWYFDHPHHHTQYNHLSTHFVEHYYGHRNSGTTITTGVRDWRERNKAVLSDEFLGNKGRLPENLKEFGKFETGREDYNTKNPRAPLTQEAYLDKNAKKFPDVKRSSEVAQKEVQRETERSQAKRSDWAPAKAPARPEPAAIPKTERAPRVSNPTTPIPPRTEPPATREPLRQPKTQPEAAKDYHRQQWEQEKPAQRTPQTQPSPRTPTPAPRRAPTAPQKSRSGGNRGGGQ